jgi:exopolysaccharide biosynthesis polyprenyl glycosylphosphotransferase
VTPGPPTGHSIRAGLPGARPDRPALAIAVDGLGAAVPMGLVLGLAHTADHSWSIASVTGVSWVVIGLLRGRYSRQGVSRTGAVRPVLREWCVLVGVLAVIRSFLELSVVPGPSLLALLPLLLVTCLRRKLTQRRLAELHRRGVAVHRVLVVGNAQAVDTVVGRLTRQTHHEYAVVGACLVGSGEPADGTTVAGRLAAAQDTDPAAQAARDEADRDAVLEAARQLDAGAVFVAAGPELSGERLRRLAWAVHESGRQLSVLPGIVEVSSRRVCLGSAAGLTLLHVAAPVSGGVRVRVKGAADRLAALSLLALLSPLLVLLALVVKLTSRGPVLHRQVRAGRFGEPFTMLKFRSMVADAERQRVGLDHLNEQDGRMFKIRKDPRVTRVGAVLRRYSLDELPQLFNVLSGRMSLVGPRPPVPEEVAGYTEVELRRLHVRPGLTGLWQVSGRSDLSWDETVALDLRYVDNWSLGGDMNLLARTLRAVAEGRGAY